MKNSDINKYSREIVTSILGIMILVLLLFSTSYAVFVESVDGEKINSITTGYLSLSYTDNANNIVNLTNAFPISDEVGKFDASKGYEFEFTVSNNFSQEINYDIIIDELVSEIDSKYLKIYLMDASGVSLYTDLEVPVLSSFEMDDMLGERVIYSDKLSLTKETFKLRVWVSDEYTDNSKPVAFSFRVSVRGRV